MRTIHGHNVVSRKLGSTSYVFQVREILRGTSETTPATLTVGEGMTVHGIGSITGYYAGDSMVNHGTIQADEIPYGSHVPTVSVPLTNHGTVRTCGTEALKVTNLQGNTGTIQAGTGADDTGMVTLSGTWTNTGTLIAMGKAVLNTVKGLSCRSLGRNCGLLGTFPRTA